MSSQARRALVDIHAFEHKDLGVALRSHIIPRRGFLVAENRAYQITFLFEEAAIEACRIESLEPESLNFYLS